MDLEDQNILQFHDRQANEVFLGTAPINCRKLWVLSRILERESKRLSVEIQFMNLSMEELISCEDAARMIQLSTRSETIRDIFWIMVKDELNLWGGIGPHENIGLRKNWAIVKFKSGGSLLDALRGLI